MHELRNNLSFIFPYELIFESIHIHFCNPFDPHGIFEEDTLEDFLGMTRELDLMKSIPMYQAVVSELYVYVMWTGSLSFSF